jgi:hypothetical protein
MSELKGGPPGPKSRSPRSGWNHPRANRNKEALNSFDTNENFRLVKTRLQQRFGLLPATAAVIAELAFASGCSR